MTASLHDFFRHRKVAESPFGRVLRGNGGVKVFVGYDSTQREAFDVFCHSLEEHCSINFELFGLVMEEFKAYTDWWRDADPLQSTEFTYLRFAVPWLCNYEGRALFMDCDMLAMGDLAEILKLPMDDYALRVVKHDHQPTSQVKMGNKVQTSYPRKNWSSMMLMDCSKLTLWSFEACNEWSGKQLHRFEGIPDEQVGELPDGWNVLDRYDENTKLVHYTEGGPWLPGFAHHQYGDVWFEAREKMRSKASPQLDPD